MCDTNSLQDSILDVYPGFKSDDPYEILKSRCAYNQFVALKDASEEPLTFEEWEAYIGKLESSDQNKPHAALGLTMPVTIPSQIATVATNVGIGALSDTAMKILSDGATIDNIVKGGAEFLQAQVNKQQERFQARDTGIGGIGKGGDGGTTTSDYSGGTNFNPTGMSLNLKPVQSSFKTDIVPLYRPKYFLDGLDNSAYLLLKVANVYPDIRRDNDTHRFDMDDPTYMYLQNKLLASWISVVSRRVKLNSFLSPLLTYEQIANYFASISYCLGVYYSYASIIAHFRLEENRNDAMIALYKSLSVADLNNIGILRQLLNEIPLDPTVNEFMFHLYGNYKQSMLPGSPLVKIIPVKFTNNAADNNFSTLEVGEVNKCIELLSKPKFRQFQQLMVQAFPDLCKTELLGYSGVPEYDPNWLTYWVNAPYITSNSSTISVTQPQVISDITRVKMLLHTDSPDGWIEGASSIFNTTVTRFEGGLGAPKKPVFNATDGLIKSELLESSYKLNNVTRYTSAYIFREDTNAAGLKVLSFWPMATRESSMDLSGMTYKAHSTSASITEFQRFGTQVALPRTILDNVPVIQQFIDFMYSPYKYAPSSSVRQITQGSADIAVSESKFTSKGKRSKKRGRSSKPMMEEDYGKE